MPSVFSRILAGELPAHFVWQDDRCAAFLSINPLQVGHTLVVPRDEIDHWLDVPAELNAHMLGVAQAIGRAQMAAFRPVKVGLMVAGLEVPHTHYHVVPIHRLADLDFANAAAGVPQADLASACERLRAALRAVDGVDLDAIPA